MNVVFVALIALSFVFGAANGLMAEVGKAAMEGAKSAVELSLSLAGAIVLFLGLMKIVEEAGGLALMARVIRPLMVKLFPDVPADHPAMGAMVMNLAANVIGLGNAATPFGLKAMKELNTLNREPGTATNAMVLFLVINTSGVAVLPTGVIGLRASLGSLDPASIFPTTLIATACSTIIGVMAVLLMRRFFPRSEAQRLADEAIVHAPVPWSAFAPLVLFVGILISMVVAVHQLGEVASAYILPTLVMGMVGIGVVRKVKVYETFIAGAKEGFTMAVGLIPYLVAMLAAVSMLRASGGLGKIVGLLSPLTAPLGLPGEVLPLALLRPLSGSGAFALTTDLVKTHGPDSYIGQLASTLNGSMETTFYVLAVYFGSIGISRTRHAVPAGLVADLCGIVGSVVAVRWLLQ
jgi:spore maturation protein SpmA